ASVTLSLPGVRATGREGVRVSAHAIADLPGLSEGVVWILGWHDIVARKSFAAGVPESVAVTLAGELAIVALPAFVTGNRIGWTASFCPRLYVTTPGCAFVRRSYAAAGPCVSVTKASPKPSSPVRITSAVGVPDERSEVSNVTVPVAFAGRSTVQSSPGPSRSQSDPAGVTESTLVTVNP